MRAIVRTTYALRPLLSFLVPEAQDRVLERVSDATLAIGIVGASGCAGDTILWTADGESVGVSHLPAGAVVAVDVRPATAGSVVVRALTANPVDGQPEWCVIRCYVDTSKAIAEAQRIAERSGCEYTIDAEV